MLHSQVADEAHDVREPAHQCPVQGVSANISKDLGKQIKAPDMVIP